MIKEQNRVLEESWTIDISDIFSIKTLKKGISNFKSNKKLQINRRLVPDSNQRKR